MAASLASAETNPVTIRSGELGSGCTGSPTKTSGMSGLPASRRHATCRSANQSLPLLGSTRPTDTRYGRSPIPCAARKAAMAPSSGGVNPTSVPSPTVWAGTRSGNASLTSSASSVVRNRRRSASSKVRRLMRQRSGGSAWAQGTSAVGRCPAAAAIPTRVVA